MSLYYVHMSGLIAYDEVVDLESTVDWRGLDILQYFDGEESNGEAVALRNTLLLMLWVWKGGSHTYPKCSFEEKVFYEHRQSSS